MRIYTQMGIVLCDEKLISPLLTFQDAKSAVFACGLRDKVVALGLHHAKLLDYLNDEYRDWSGCFYDRRPAMPSWSSMKAREVFVDMDPLYEAPVEWWRDTFGPKAVQSPIIRIRREALPRWRAIGSLYYAWHPNQRPAWLSAAANDNDPPQIH